MNGREEEVVDGSNIYVLQYRHDSVVILAKLRPDLRVPIREVYRSRSKYSPSYLSKTKFRKEK